MVEKIKIALKLGLFGWCYALGTLLVGIVFPLRISGKRSVPRSGPVLVISNHQSFLDPVVLGLALGRPACYLARSTLFRHAPFRWLITALGAVRIHREGLGKAGLQDALRRLAAGQVVVLWPEGTRTRDGSLGKLYPGVLLLVRRGQAPIVVAGVDGAYESWPRHWPIPRPWPLWVHFARFQPANGDNDELLKSLHAALQSALGEARRRRQYVVGTMR